MVRRSREGHVNGPHHLLFAPLATADFRLHARSSIRWRTFASHAGVARDVLLFGLWMLGTRHPVINAGMQTARTVPAHSFRKVNPGFATMRRILLGVRAQSVDRRSTGDASCKSPVARDR